MIFDANGNVIQERRYDNKGNLIFDSIEALKAAVEAEKVAAEKRAAAEKFIADKVAERRQETIVLNGRDGFRKTVTRTVDGFGRLVGERIEYGDGDANSHIEVEYDLNNQQAWSQRIRTIYKDKVIINEFIIRDDGTSKATDYNTKTGKEEGHTEYDKNGEAISHTNRKWPGNLPPIYVYLPIPLLEWKMQAARANPGWDFDPKLPTPDDIFPSAAPSTTTGTFTRPVGGFPVAASEFGFPKLPTFWNVPGTPTLPSIVPLPTFKPVFINSGPILNGMGFGYFDLGNGKFTNPIIFPEGRPPSWQSVNLSDTKPVLLDLNRDNLIDLRPLDLLTTSSTPHFDWNGDGTPDKTAWVGPDDGLLVIDLGKSGATGPDGTIDQAREIAFSLWKTEAALDAEIKASVTDLEGLRFAFDTNRDDVLDARDARWADFRIWQDRNQDGVSDPGELFGLDELGIKLINLLPDPEGARQFADGSVITGTTTALLADGSTMLVGDAALRFQPSHATHQMA